MTRAAHRVPDGGGALPGDQSGLRRGPRHRPRLRRAARTHPPLPRRPGPAPHRGRREGGPAGHRHLPLAPAGEGSTRGCSSAGPQAVRWSPESTTATMRGLPREAGWNAAGEDRARAVSRRGRPGHGWFVHRQALLVGEGGRGRRRLAPRPHPPVSGASNTADTSAANPSSSAEAAISPRPYRPCSTYASPRSTSTVSVSSRGSAIQYSGILASA